MLLRQPFVSLYDTYNYDTYYVNYDIDIWSDLVTPDIMVSYSTVVVKTG